MSLFCIYARAANGAIGKDGRLPWQPWHLPADLKRFKALTMGKPMVMGRKTFESLPGLLPGRRHIVLTRRERWDCEGADVVRSVDEAVALLAGEPASVIGGAAIFDVFLPIATRAELTEIHADFDGDVFMRPLPAGWGVVARKDHAVDGDRPAYSFVSYERGEDQAA